MSPPWLFVMWGKETHHRTLVVVKMDNPNWVMVDLQGPSEEDFLLSGDRGDGGQNRRAGEKSRGKNTRQFTHLGPPQPPEPPQLSASEPPSTSIPRLQQNQPQFRLRQEPDRFYAVIKLFLWLSIDGAIGVRGRRLLPMLAFRPNTDPAPTSIGGTAGGTRNVRFLVLELGSNSGRVPCPYAAVPDYNMCVVLFLMQSLDRLVLCLGLFWIQFMNIKPVPRQIPVDLESSEKGFFPMVLVQIPTCNEKELMLCNDCEKLSNC